MSIQLKIGPDHITSYRRLDYSAWHAIAEFVDNSTQSFFDHQEELIKAYAKKEGGESLRVDIVYERESGVMRISDNAMGMTRDGLERAMHVAKPPQNTSGRSKYGMGLKTAACWMGNMWTVRTKRMGEAVEHRVTVDVDKIARGDSDLQYKSIPDRPVDEHYTVIEIYKHIRKFVSRTPGKIKEFLGSMYRQDFRNKSLILTWNGEPITWTDDEDRYLLDKAGKPYKKTFSFDVDNKPVTGWVGILARGGREEAGFSILHCGRMVWGYPDSWRPSSLYGQLQGSNDLVNQRLVGEIHLFDGFDVTHTKDKILWLGDEEEKVEEKLREHCADYRNQARVYRKGDEDSRGPSQIEMDAAIDEFKRELDSPEMVDLIEIETVPPAEVVSNAVDSITKSIVESREETHRAKIGELTVRLYVEHDMSPNDPYVSVDARHESEVIVVINQAHPHWNQLKGSEGVINYMRHCTYDGIAEWQTRSKAARIDPDTIKLLKDKLLRMPLEMEKHAKQ
jgi:hypothetical protein